MRVVAFDLETTGTNPDTDRIVELCLMPLGGPAEVFRVNPGVPIPQGATEVHGIRDEDVQDAPSFAEIAPKVQAAVEGAALLGYNSRSFDTPMLHAELLRAGQPGLRLDALREIDVMRVWQALEPRSLSGAARRWLGKDHDGAHQARDDVEMTVRVWDAMMQARGVSVEECVRLTKPANEIDRAGKFILDGDGHVVFNFGGHYGKRVASVERYASYLEWMSKQDFPPSTKALIPKLQEHKGDLPEAAAYRARLQRDA